MLSLNLSLCNTNILIAGIYKSPTFNIRNFSDIMYNTFNNLAHRNMFIVGDFNINLHSHHNNITKYFIDTFYSMNFIPLITKSTHFYSNGNSLIDNIFTNFNKHLIYNGILITDISDHLPIFSIFDLLKNKTNDTPIFKYIRNHSQNNILKLNLSLQKVDWTDIYSCSNINIAFNHFIKIFTKFYNICCPLKKIKNKRYINNKPWITKSLLKCIHKKNKLYKKTIINSNLDMEYKNYKNCLSKILKKCEQNYYSGKLKTNNIKNTWRVLNNLMKNTNKNTIDMNNNKSDSENSNNFNKYFTSIGAEINNSFNDPYSDRLTNITSNTSSIFFEPVTVTEIENIVHKCSDKFSNDSHGFNLYLLRRIITSISHIIMYLFNLSINAGIFPDILKTSKVIVIYKKHNRSIIVRFLLHPNSLNFLRN